MTTKTNATTNNQTFSWRDLSELLREITQLFPYEEICELIHSLNFKFADLFHPRFFGPRPSHYDNKFLPELLEQLNRYYHDDSTWDTTGLKPLQSVQFKVNVNKIFNFIWGMYTLPRDDLKKNVDEFSKFLSELDPICFLRQNIDLLSLTIVKNQILDILSSLSCKLSPETTVKKIEYYQTQFVLLKKDHFKYSLFETLPPCSNNPLQFLPNFVFFWFENMRDQNLSLKNLDTFLYYYRMGHQFPKKVMDIYLSLFSKPVAKPVAKIRKLEVKHFWNILKNHSFISLESLKDNPFLWKKCTLLSRKDKNRIRDILLARSFSTSSGAKNKFSELFESVKTDGTDYNKLLLDFFNAIYGINEITLSLPQNGPPNQVPLEEFLENEHFKESVKTFSHPKYQSSILLLIMKYDNIDSENLDLFFELFRPPPQVADQQSNPNDVLPSIFQDLNFQAQEGNPLFDNYTRRNILHIAALFDSFRTLLQTSWWGKLPEKDKMYLLEHKDFHTKHPLSLCPDPRVHLEFFSKGRNVTNTSHLMELFTNPYFRHCRLRHRPTYLVLSLWIFLLSEHYGMETFIIPDNYYDIKSRHPPVSIKPNSIKFSDWPEPYPSPLTIEKIIQMFHSNKLNYDSKLFSINDVYDSEIRSFYLPPRLLCTNIWHASALFPKSIIKMFNSYQNSRESFSNLSKDLPDSSDRLKITQQFATFSSNHPLLEYCNSLIKPEFSLPDFSHFHKALDLNLPIENYIFTGKNGTGKSFFFESKFTSVLDGHVPGVSADSIRVLYVPVFNRPNLDKISTLLVRLLESMIPYSPSRQVQKKHINELIFKYFPLKEVYSLQYDFLISQMLSTRGYLKFINTQLSYGEQQCLYILCVLIYWRLHIKRRTFSMPITFDPCMILDEPTSHLQFGYGLKLMDNILNEFGSENSGSYSPIDDIPNQRFRISIISHSWPVVRYWALRGYTLIHVTEKSAIFPIDDEILEPMKHYFHGLFPPTLVGNSKEVKDQKFTDLLEACADSLEVPWTMLVEGSGSNTLDRVLYSFTSALIIPGGSTNNLKNPIFLSNSNESWLSSTHRFLPLRDRDFRDHSNSYFWTDFHSVEAFTILPAVVELFYGENAADVIKTNFLDQKKVVISKLVLKFLSSVKHIVYHAQKDFTKMFDKVIKGITDIPESDASKILGEFEKFWLSFSTGKNELSKFDYSGFLQLLKAILSYSSSTSCQELLSSLAQISPKAVVFILTTGLPQVLKSAKTLSDKMKLFSKTEKKLLWDTFQANVNHKKKPNVQSLWDKFVSSVDSNFESSPNEPSSNQPLEPEPETPDNTESQENESPVASSSAIPST